MNKFSYKGWINFPIKYIFPIFCLFASWACHADWTCPSGFGPHVLDGVGYNISHYQPRVHFSDQPANSWSYLAYSSGLNTDYGKAILSVALTAYSTGARVMVVCNGTSIDSLYISDAGGMPPN